MRNLDTEERAAIRRRADLASTQEAMSRALLGVRPSPTPSVLWILAGAVVVLMAIAQRLVL